MKIFCVFDCKAEAFLNPIYFGATGEAVRAFEAAANSESHDFAKYAADYTLFEIGTWDQVAGEIKMLKAKINLGTALQMIKQPTFDDWHARNDAQKPVPLTPEAQVLKDRVLKGIQGGE